MLAAVIVDDVAFACWLAMDPRGDDHHVVYRHSIVQECNYDLLHAREIFDIKGRGHCQWMGYIAL